MTQLRALFRKSQSKLKQRAEHIHTSLHLHSKPLPAPDNQHSFPVYLALRPAVANETKVAAPVTYVMHALPDVRHQVVHAPPVRCPIQALLCLPNFSRQYRAVSGLVEVCLQLHTLQDTPCSACTTVCKGLTPKVQISFC